MALPGSGPIYLSQIQAEFGGPNYLLSTYYRGGGYVTANNTSVPVSGPISLANFYGASKVVPGTYDNGTPGTHYVTIPAYTTLTVTVWGAGGGGAASGTYSNISYDGGNSAFYAPGYTLVGYGGGRGGNIYFAGGAGGGASGGVSNWSGGAGGTGFTGGAGAQGGAGGAGEAAAGGWPGGGGGAISGGSGYAGGGGGCTQRTFTVGEPGAPVPGNTYTVVVGAGGAASAAGGYYGGGPGGNGRVCLSWS